MTLFASLFLELSFSPDFSSVTTLPQLASNRFQRFL
jgi:hypothetical protein